MSEYLRIARQVLRDRQSNPTTNTDESLEHVLNGRAVELYLTDGQQLFIVADEEDARLLGADRGTVYTAAEVRCVVQIEDPSVVLEIDRWKRIINGRLRDLQLDAREEPRHE